MTIVGYEISLATSADVDGILELQEENLSHRGGMLSVALSREWFERTLSEMPIIVTRNEGRMVGFLVSSSFAAFAKVAVIESYVGCLLWGRRRVYLWTNLRCAWRAWTRIGTKNVCRAAGAVTGSRGDFVHSPR